jgi:hypothetical protein
MLEVISLVLIVIILVLVLYFLTSRSSYETRVLELEKELVYDKQKLKIAERKYMQGKIKKDIFDPLLDDIESDVTEKELEIYKYKKMGEVSTKEKLKELLSRMDRPTGFKKAQLEKLIKESESLRSEMGMLEAKLMKREINESVFRKMIQKKEKEMITIESDIIKLISKE